MSKSTILGETQVTTNPPDIVTIELTHPEGMLPTVRITWPLQPTVVDPASFRDAAAAMVKLFSESHITLARIRAERRI